MFNEAHISLNGYVATQPTRRETRTGVPALSWRVAWTPRRFDRETSEWIDLATSFASVRCFRKLAENAATCLRKGDPVIVRGRVTMRDYQDKNGLPRTTMEIDAISIGHDLSRGVAQFQRVRPQTGMTALEYQATEGTDSGTAELDAEAAELESVASGLNQAGGSAGQDGEMFDEEAVGVLAEQAAGMTAPF
jgi:single-strand DNA-binding protein